MKRILLALVLVLFTTALIASIAQAAHPQAGDCPDGPFDENGDPRDPSKCACENVDFDDEQYCMSGFSSLGYMIRDLVRSSTLGIQKAISVFIWLLMRVTAIVADALIRGDIWEMIRDTVLDGLESVVGGRDGVLYQIIGPQTGLMAIALMLAGLLMTVPMLASSATQLVKPDRVIIWGVILLSVFVSSSAGFDLIDMIENLRVDMMQVASGMSDGDEGESTNNLINLVAIPMKATPEETLQLTADTIWTLPDAFTQAYFPKVEYEPRRVIVADAPGDTALDMIFRVDVMRDGDYTNAVNKGLNALFWMLLGCVALYCLVLLALIFAVLFAAALALIIFFLAALPLGFFEFGAGVLLGIVRQYLTIVAVSLFAAIFVRLLIGSTLVTLNGVPDFTMLATYLGTLILVAVMLSMVLKLAWKVMDGSFGVMQGSLSSVAAMAYSTSGPMSATVDFAKATMSTAVTAATGAAVGFVTGGVAGAVMGGAGGLMSGSKTGSQAANYVAGNTAPDDAHAQTFVAAARSGRSPLQAATGIIATRSRPTSSGVSDATNVGIIGASPAPTEYDARKVDPKWESVQMDGYLTSDLGTLEKAERSYFQDMDSPAARRHLVSAYGNNALADEVMGIYNEDGPMGAMWVRGVTEASQIAAQETYESGSAVFGNNGQHSQAFTANMGAELSRSNLAPPGDPRQSTANRIANAAVRQPRDVWSMPNTAPRMMTRDTFNPELPKVQVGDVSAQYALRDLAKSEGWDQPKTQHKMDHIFQAYQTANARSLHGGPISPDAVYDEMRDDSKLYYESPDALREAARLVTLVGGQAEVQHGEDMPEREANLYRDDDGLTIKAPFSGDLQRRMFDEIPSDSREWDAGNGEWNITPDYADDAEQIVQELSEEHGWAVRYPDEDISHTQTTNRDVAVQQMGGSAQSQTADSVPTTLSAPAMGYAPAGASTDVAPGSDARQAGATQTSPSTATEASVQGSTPMVDSSADDGGIVPAEDQPEQVHVERESLHSDSDTIATLPDGSPLERGQPETEKPAEQKISPIPPTANPTPANSSSAVDQSRKAARAPRTRKA